MIPMMNSLSYTWWVYPEAGVKPYGKPLKIDNPYSAITSLEIPKDAAIKELHIILEVKDDNDLVPLVAYRRMVVIVTNY